MNNKKDVQSEVSQEDKEVKRSRFGHINPKNGALSVTLRQLVNVFFVSHFNRDMKHDYGENEEYDFSYKWRVYNKYDLDELADTFVEFLEWLLTEKNLERIQISNNLVLARESTLPRVKYATGLDERYTSQNCKEGEYYITNGRYKWVLNLKGDAFKKSKELWLKDPEFIKVKEELVPIMEEKNNEIRNKNTN